MVQELVDQFADSFAFLRELVQNALDAGTTRIDVRVDADGRGARVSVRDDGEGMTREILEDKLLVLFQSGKEAADDKIGKFGVGFISVLALKPDQVVVTTSTGASLFTLELSADHTYELFEREGNHPSGTSVTLHIPKLESSLDAFSQACALSLRKWCRHAATPIFFLDAQSEQASVRIDTKLAIPDAEVVAQCRRDSETGSILVGIPAWACLPRAEFFNRGLTLFETSERVNDGVLGRLHLKIQDNRLEHTLSRDNVKRDAAFYELMKDAERLARDGLRTSLLAELARAAECGDGYAAVLQAAELYFSELDIDAKQVSVPLLHPLSGRRSTRAGSLAKTALLATGVTPLTHALAQAGHEVVASEPRTEPFLRKKLGLREASREATFIREVTVSGSDLALLSLLEDLLEVKRRPAGVQLVELFGRGETLLFIGQANNVKDRLLFGDPTGGDPFRLLGRPELLLNARDPSVMGARKMAVGDPQLAASLLSRVILGRHGSLSASIDLELTKKSLSLVLGISE